MSSSPSYLDPIVLPLLAGGSVLDVGCGVGRWGHLIRANYWEAGLTEPPPVDGVDAFAPNVDACRRGGAYRHVWLQTLPGELNGAWDTVLACEVIEHIAANAVDDVLDEIERVAMHRVILTTPNFPALREGVESTEGFNEFDAHLSYVSRTRLKARGYRVIGAGFGNPRHPVVRLGVRLRLASSLTSLPRHLPSLGESVVAVKDIRRN
jgi:2-polyprenyl-3-methyl-5-hydroxy-6-metoxy-1,4-benzoquinol methylase